MSRLRCVVSTGQGLRVDSEIIRRCDLIQQSVSHARRCLLATLSLTFAGLGSAQDVPRYEGFEVRQVLVAQKDAEGQVKYSVDTGRINAFLAGLLPHAQGQPARFANDEDRGRARQDVTQLSAVLVKLTQPDDCSTRLLYQSAVLHSLAHNMGLRSAVHESERCFRRLLEREPKNPKYHFLFGRHLLFSDRIARGVSHLEKADALKHEQAAFSLGLAYALQGNKKNALECLTRYLQRNPDDPRAAAALTAVRQDRIKPPDESSDSLWDY